MPISLKHYSLRFVRLLMRCAVLGGFGARAATVTWDGGGGDTSWQNPLNWSADVVPGPSDSVEIQAAPGVTIVVSGHVVVGRLQSANPLNITSGLLRVTSGSSVIAGDVTASGSPTLSCTGAGSTLEVGGVVRADGLNLEATGGALLRLPGLATYRKGTGCNTVFWQVSDAGSLLDLPGLGELTGASCASLVIDARSGGTVLLPNLATVLDGVLSFVAEGPASHIDLPRLDTCRATARAVAFQATGGGSIALPLLPGGPGVTVTLDAVSSLPLDGFRQVGGFHVVGGTPSFPNVTNVGSLQVVVEGGAQVILPQLQSITGPAGCASTLWQVTDAGSALTLPLLQQFPGAPCGTFSVQVLDGGSLVLPALAGIPEGSILFSSEGAGSRIDLGGIRRVNAVLRTVSLKTARGGAILAPLLEGGPATTLSVDGPPTVPVAQLRELAGFSVAGAQVDFPALTNVTTGLIAVTAGASVSVPLLTNYVHARNCGTTDWQVSGAGSRLEFPGLASLTGFGCGSLRLRALQGGRLVLPGLTRIPEGVLQFSVEGAGSRLELPSLGRCDAVANVVSLSVLGGGTLDAPLLTGGPEVSLAFDGASSVPVSQFTELFGLSVAGAAAEFSSLTNLTFGNVTAASAAQVSLPRLVAHTGSPGCGESSWQATGVGSRLLIDSLARLTGGACTFLHIEAFAGGLVSAVTLDSVGAGQLHLLADGPGSRVQIPRLVRCDAAPGRFSLEASSLGTIEAPLFEGGSVVEVTIRSNGELPVDRLQRLTGITLSGVERDFPALVEFDQGHISVSDGGRLTAGALAHWTQNASCAPATWLASGVASRLELPSLTEIVGSDCIPLEAQAQGGGVVELAVLGRIPSGAVRLISSGSGSVLDLPGLTNFANVRGLSVLSATNGGSVRLSDQPAVFSGVRVRLDAVPDAQPAVHMDPGSVVLHARPWHSYCVQRRAPGNADAPWVPFARVPLQEPFEIIGSRPATAQEFLAQEFIARPHALDIGPRIGDQARLVLYAPEGDAFDLAQSPILGPGAAWTRFATLTMTNTFRILSVPATDPAAFFRAYGRPPTPLPAVPGGRRP